eukprot:964914-Amphidinium_carterae.1
MDEEQGVVPILGATWTSTLTFLARPSRAQHEHSVGNALSQEDIDIHVTMPHTEQRELCTLLSLFCMRHGHMYDAGPRTKRRNPMPSVFLNSPPMKLSLHYYGKSKGSM